MTKKTLVIMGTHPTGLKTFDWTRTDCDIWMFNEAANFKGPDGKLLYPRADAVIQLHHEAIWKNPYNRSDKEHFKWLKSGKTPTIYMQKHYSDVPKSVRYPIEDVLSLVKNIRLWVNNKEKDFKYFSSSPDYAFALAALMWKQGKKYQKVEVHGIELQMESEYQFQKTGFGFWTGYLTALGVELVLYNSIFDAPMYGYEGDVAISAEQIEKRIAELTQELGTEKDLYNQKAKSFLEGLSGLLRANISAQIQKELNDLTKSSESAGILNGRLNENKKFLEKARAMEEKTGSAVFALGELDGQRIAYNQQYMGVKAQNTNLNTPMNFHLKRLLNLKKGSQKRQRALDEFGKSVAELMNKNMLMLHIIGAIRENQYYIDSFKLSIRVGEGS